MDEDLFTLPMRTPTANRPLLGMTVLVVEDSRFASEALRLLCLRSGARIRRADSLSSAHRHLKVYRPAIVIVDIGLRDGNGADLISELAAAQPRIGVIIGLSGDPDCETEAMKAGADGFLHKPVTSLGKFQQTVIAHLPEDLRAPGPRAVPQDRIEPDMIAYQDDLAHLADVLNTAQDDAMMDYVAQFLRGVAQSADDGDMARAASDLAAKRACGGPTGSEIARIAGLVQERLQERIAL